MIMYVVLKRSHWSNYINKVEWFELHRISPLPEEDIDPPPQASAIHLHATHHHRASTYHTACSSREMIIMIMVRRPAQVVN